jgi:rhodanese-related sulfurtransferase
MSIKELSPAETAILLAAGTIQLVDVREPAEFAAEHIAGAISMPLSRFNPAELKLRPGVEPVFQCGIGKRSRMALDKCAQLGFPHATHLAGGLAAWKAANLPTTR